MASASPTAPPDRPSLDDEDARRARGSPAFRPSCVWRSEAEAARLRGLMTENAGRSQPWFMDQFGRAVVSEREREKDVRLVFDVHPIEAQQRAVRIGHVHDSL